jgi:hypothetical protein
MSMLKKGDLVLAAVLVAAALGAAAAIGVYRNLNAGSEKTAVIKYGSHVIKRVDLNKADSPQRIEISKEYKQVVLIEKGRIRFEESECPDKICVNTGWLSHMGQTAVCVPNRTIIIIEGEPEELDGVTY